MIRGLTKWALLGLLVAQLVPLVHARLIGVGQGTWPQYSALRLYPVAPTCGVDPVAVEEEPDDALDDLFGEEDETDTDALAEAQAKADRDCADKKVQFGALTSSETLSLRAYRSIERSIGAVSAALLETQRLLFVLLLMLFLSVTTRGGHHLSIRSPETRQTYRVARAVQTAAFGLLALSNAYSSLIHVRTESSAETLLLDGVWVTGWLLQIGLLWWRRPGPEAEGAPSIWAYLMSLPLFSVMALLSMGYFLLVEGHGSGAAIYLEKLTEHASLYLNVALYVWAGMLLRTSNLVHRLFRCLQILPLRREWFAVLVLAVTALPTAYSGASGIFVMAAGALVFRELLASGCSGGLAAACTAMSGSMGVVLRPCLLVVLIASLNKQVTTDELYGHGLLVFGLSLLVFLTVVVVRNRAWTPWMTGVTVVPRSESADRLRGLVVLVFAFAVPLLLLTWLLGARLDEHSAPVLLPWGLLGLWWWERARRGDGATQSPDYSEPVEGQSLHHVGHSAAGYAGALLTLMALSVCLGGVIERAELVLLLPQSLGSPVSAMLLLSVALVLIGMVMDPYGAVILVSATLAPIAYNSGIHPAHFWMVVLVAFELGYLTPPVALNQLITREVVPEVRELPPSEQRVALFLPLTVMATTLLLVAFGPLF